MRSATAQAKDKDAFDAASDGLRKARERVQKLQALREERSSNTQRVRRDLEATQEELARVRETITTRKAALESVDPVDLNGLAILQREQAAADKELALAQTDKKDADSEARIAAEKAQASADEGNLQALITRGGAVFGAVGILILLIQVFVSTTRYHARLADLYKAQAIALGASGGDVDTAKALLERLSPLQVDFGKTPTSLYEKALDTVSQVAKTRGTR